MYVDRITPYPDGFVHKSRPVYAGTLERNIVILIYEATVLTGVLKACLPSQFLNAFSSPLSGVPDI